MLCLGIESSCDETALALVRDGHLAGHILASQVDIHALFGGVVPEIASREHYRHLNALFDKLLSQTGFSASQIDAVAVSRGPGLLGSLLVGVAFAKGLALGLDIPILGVNHLHAHLLAAGLDHKFRFPCLGLLVSGGHTSIYRIESVLEFVLLGRTIDDAVGETFDKVGSLLGMLYPCGRLFDEISSGGAADPHLFPRPYLHNDNLDFSFSGLKTAASAYIGQNLHQNSWPRPLLRARQAPRSVKDFCASFTLAVVDTICHKVIRALESEKPRAIVLAGGVAANSHLRASLSELARQYGVDFVSPQAAYCTDNGVMIAYAGWLLARHGYASKLSFPAVPRGRKIPCDITRATDIF